MKIKCQDCNGTGLVGMQMDRDCEPCGGTGLVIRVTPAGGPDWPDTNDGRLALAICEIEDLSDWEGGFAESIADAVLNGIPLSSRQRAKAEEILEGQHEAK